MVPTACSSARGPRPARSCTYILKPPPVPMPGTEGGGITSTKASRSACIWPRRSFRMLSVVSPAFTRSSNGFKRDEHHAGIRRVGEGGAVEAGERHRVRHAGPRQQDVRGLAHDAVGALQARARRQGNRGDEVGAIERRDEARRRARELQIGEPDQPAVEHQHDRRHPQHAPRQPGIARRQLLEHPVEAGEEGVERPARPSARCPLRSLMTVRPQQQRRQAPATASATRSRR